VKRLLIVNPNTNVAVTRWLAEEARRVAPAGVEMLALNADSGLAALQTPADIGIASRAVARAIQAQARAGDLAGVVIAAFGDPGLKEARALGATRVVGLGEAGLGAAARGGRGFSIVTLGAAMRELVADKAAALGFGSQLVEVDVLPFSIPDMIADREAARAAIVEAVRRCAGEAVLLGGAPFAGMARPMAQATGRLVFDGVEVCVRAILGD
jgi:Asp/Glu/hydantoin racemase